MATDPQAGDRQAPEQKENLREIVTDLTQQTTTLVRQELELLRAELAQKTDLLKQELDLTSSQARMEIDAAKAEMIEAAKQAGIGAGLFGAAGLLGLGAFATVTAALVAVLAVFMPVWLSAFAVTIAYGAVAGGLAWVGRNKIQQADIPIPSTVNKLKALLMRSKNRVQHEVSPLPQQTIESLKAAKQDLSQAWRGGHASDAPTTSPNGQGETSSSAEEHKERASE